MIRFPVSFVIITDGRAQSRISETLGSIRMQNLPDPQVIIVGGENTFGSEIHHIPFDDGQSTRPWITRKKNVAARSVKHDVTVWMHDYHVFDPEWYSEMVAFGLDWDVQMNQVRMTNGHRMFDWVNLTYPNLPSHYAIPYDRNDLIQHQYIPGGYWISKRHVMIEEPLNESLRHFDCEDVEWSKRVLPKYKYAMNHKAIVRHNKEHRECPLVASRETQHAAWTGWE